MSNPFGSLPARVTRFALLAAVSVHLPASLAHSVIVWAEVIGDQIHVESYASDGEKAKRGRVEILDQTGSTILHGQLNEEGRFRFATPDGAAALTIRVLLGSQHVGVFELPLGPGRAGADSSKQ